MVELLDFSNTSKVIDEAELLMAKPGTRYLYFPSSNTNTCISLIELS